MSKHIGYIKAYNYDGTFSLVELKLNKSNIYYIENNNQVYITKEVLIYMIDFYVAETGNTDIDKNKILNTIKWSIKKYKHGKL